MNQKRIRAFTIVSISVLLNIFLFSSFLVADDRVYIDISASKTRKINFAVPWFINKDLPDQKQPYGRDLSETLSKALEFHGIISVIPSAKYGGTQRADLKPFGADFTIHGNYTISGDTLRFELRLIDVENGKMLFGKSYNGHKTQKDQILFKFCDKVIKELTGQNGIASTQIAFIAPTTVSTSFGPRTAKELFVTDILGNTVRQVTRHKNIVVSPRFTPDGVNLSYSSYHSKTQKLYITDLQQNVSTTVLSRRKGLNVAPGWSPDGRNMIVTLSHEGGPDLYLMDMRGRILKRLTKNAGANISASWSPNGREIVFVSDRSGKPQLYIMNMSSGKTQRLTFEGSENIEPTWSKHDNLIVYTSLRNGRYQIFTMKPDPSAIPTQITTDNTNNESPHWSPDGNQIVFVKKVGNQRKAYAIMKNGTYERKLFNFTGTQAYPRWAKHY